MIVPELMFDKLAGFPWLPVLLLAVPLSFAAALAHAGEPPAPSPAAAALQLLRVTNGDARARILQPFTDEARSDWHYTPRRRAGLPWRDMTAEQRGATRALLLTALTAPGLDKVQAVMALEIALRELETFGSSRDPENYAVALFGSPSTPAAHWGFRLEGHHLSLHFTLQGDRYLSTLPQFMGSNPALVPRDIEAGPRAGTRVLGEEEDLARALLGALGPAQRKAAHFDSRTYGDIVSRNARKLDPLSPVGVGFEQLPAAEQASLLRLIQAFASHLRPELAEARLARVRAGGLPSIRFGWAGASKRGEPFYFRVQGKSFLIEYDNSGGNHVHSVWRDFAGDFGRDVLGEHYAGAADAHGHRPAH